MPAPALPPGTDIWAVPAGPNPNGSPPNFINPPTNQNIGVVTLSIFIALASASVAARLYVRFRIVNHTPWWDDLCLVMALPPQIAYTGITIYMMTSGMTSRHLWDTPLGVLLEKLPYWTTVVAVLPQPITLLVKNALLLLYLRIFRPKKLVRYGAYAGLSVVTAMYIAWMFIFIFQTALQNSVGEHLSWAQAAFNLVTDVYILLLPVAGVANLHISANRKLGVLAVFATGLAAIVMSSLTLYWRVLYNGVTADPTWTATTRMSVSVIEIDVGILCACMPLFAPFFPAKGRFAQWSTYLRSMRSRLLKSNPTQQSHATGVEARYGGGMSDSELVHKDGAYVELDERRSGTSSVREGQHARREWFDATTSLAHDTVVDRSSKDGARMAAQHV